MTSDRLKTKLQQICSNMQPNSKRLDCPSCGGKNTFSVTNLGTTIIFYCFRASCNFKGKRSADISIKTLMKEFKNPVENTPNLLDITSFMFIPETPHRNRISEYLHDTNCWDSYREGRADIRYDPKEDRVIFMIYKSVPVVSLVGAIGRKISRTDGSKWKRYGVGLTPFICRKDQEGKSSTLILVEDCNSACAASAYADSAALLGTFLQASYLKEFLKYDKFIIALDQDASKLAVKMQRELCYYKPTTILLLTEDLKTCNKEEIRRLFNV